jgi:hypothetical protein
MLREFNERTVGKNSLRGAQQPDPLGRHAALNLEIESSFVEMRIEDFNDQKAMRQQDFLEIVKKRQNSKLMTGWIHDFIGRYLDEFQVHFHFHFQSRSGDDLIYSCLVDGQVIQRVSCCAAVSLSALTSCSSFITSYSSFPGKEARKCIQIVQVSCSISIICRWLYRATHVVKWFVCDKY